VLCQFNGELSDFLISGLLSRALPCDHSARKKKKQSYGFGFDSEQRDDGEEVEKMEKT
jgi:hypothetical protein